MDDYGRVVKSGYVNFGTSGSAGYGIRDNGGTVEYKNSENEWKGIGGFPQNIQTSNYTTVLSDQGGHILYPGTMGTAGTGRTWTIEGTCGYSTGGDITFINEGSGSAGTLSILLSTGSLVLMGSGTTGTRSLAPYGIATAVKIGDTKWVIGGINLT